MALQGESAFGALLQRYRLAAGFTQEYLAERASLSARGISDLERGLIRRPRADTARLIADALGLARYDRAIFLETARRGAARTTMAEQMPHMPSGGYLGAIPIGPLIGREPELARVEAALDEVLRGDGRFVVLSGEPGVGKTRLAQEAMLELRRRGFLAATGRCYGAEQSAPYYPFLDVLSRLYRDAPQPLRNGVPTRWPYLIRLLPEEHLPAPRAIGDSQEQQRLFRAVSSFVLELSTETPVAVLIDDLHWADNATLKLLHHLVLRTRTHRVLFLATYRGGDIEPAPRLADAILDLERERLVEIVTLSRLTQQETLRMLGALLGAVEGLEDLGHALYRRSEGNPFFTQELVRALVERGDLYLLDGRWHGQTRDDAPLPDTIRAVVRQRLARLTPTAQRIVQDASVLGQRFQFEELRLLAGADERAVEAALDDGRAAGIVRIVDRDRYAFTHALIHGALAADLSPTRSRRLHLQAGSILGALPAHRRAGRAAEIARHFREGDDIERTLRWTVAAGDEAEAVFAHGRARREYRAALTLLEDAGIGEDERRALECHVLVHLGHVLVLAARHDEAVLVFERAIAVASGAGDLEHLARAVAGVARLHRDRGTPAEGIELITPLLTRLGDDGVTPETRASVYIALANLCFVAGRYDDLLWAAERAVAHARAAGNDWILAAAEGRYGLALMQNDRPDEARQALETTVARAEAANNLESLAHSLNNLGGLAWNQARLEDQLRYRQRCLEIAERMDDQHYRVVALSHLGGAYMVLGHWKEARVCQERAMTALESVGSSARAAYPYAAMVMLTCAEGDFEEAGRFAEKGLEIAQHSGDLQAISFLERDLAEVNRLRGRPEESRDRLEALRDRLGDTHATAPRILPALAETYLALGEIERAKDVADLAIARVAEVKQYLVLIDTLRVRGAVLSHMGEWVEAEATLREAVERARAVKYPLGLARALDELGQLLSRKGEQQSAAPLLDEAQSIYHQLGAAAHYRH